MSVQIVMPTYMQGDHIADAFDSIVNQDHINWRLYIVVDGPPDAGTKEFIRAIGHDSRVVTVIELPENVGTARALNVGFKYAAKDDDPSDYWTWVSSDNIMHPEWLSTLVFDLGGVDCVYSAYDRQDGKISLIDGTWQATRTQKFYVPPRDLTLSEDCFIGPSFLYHRYLHELVGGHRGRISHDYDWWCRAQELGTIKGVDQALCTYRVHSERVTVTRRNEYDARFWRSEAIRRRAEAGV